MNIDDAEDQAPAFGAGEALEARFVRDAVGAQHIGMAHYRMRPGKRLGFGHKHSEVEEMYVVLGGSGRFRVDDEVLDITSRDVVYCPPDAMREWEAGPDGMELLAFGGHVEGDAEMQPGWWPRDG